MAKGTEVATKEQMDEGQVPSYLQNYSTKNVDNFDSTDIVIPRIKLLQGLSGEVETFNEAKAGLFWHTGMDIPLGENFKFVIADRRKKFLLSAPLSDGQGILARADDAKTWDRTGSWTVKLKNIKNPVTWEITETDVEKSGLTKWGTYNPDDEDSPPAATLFYDYLVFTPEYPDLGPSVISLARSQIKKAKKGLNDKITLHGTNGRPMQSLVFEAKSVEETGEEGPYKNWQFRSTGFVQDEAFFKMLLEYKGALSTYKIQDENLSENDEVQTDDGDEKF